ncbi:MAG TPA: amidohydrolase family protein [Nevskiaceae bacterium]|nr:amidohydrolase family protein [Nevskiaceae bacterium]
MVRLCLILLLALSATPAAGQLERRYEIHIQGERVGHHRVIERGSRLEVDYHYRNNGRGPDYRETLELDDQGLPRRFVLEGRSTYGAALRERFERRAGEARWESAADRGRSREGGAYLPLESSPEVLALMAAAALAREDHRLPLLPSGQLQADALRQLRLADGRAVELVGLRGLGLQPLYVWIDPAPPRRLHAVIIPGYLQLLPEGRAADGAALEAAQLEAEEAVLAGFAERHGEQLPEPLLIRGARLFDAERAELTAPRNVYIHHGRISAIQPVEAPVREAGSEIDGRGQVLLPGLFDMHGHESAWNGPLHLAAGVTSVRDMGNDNATLDRYRRQLAEGRRIGPTITPLGLIEGRSEFASRGGFVVDSLATATEAAEWYAQRGLPGVKLYNSVRPEWVAPLAEQAHALGLRVAGHVPAFMRAEEAVRAGYDELTHINQVLLNFIVRPEDDTRTLARFYLILEQAHRLDFSEPRFAAFIELLKTRGTVVDPTLATFEDMYQAPGMAHPSFAAVLDHLPPALQRSLRSSSFEVPPRKQAQYRRSFDRMGEFVQRLHAAGVPLLAGTDNLPGLTLHRELELYVQYGIPAAEALKIATYNGARYSGRLAETGTLTVGKRADLILIAGDPLQDIRQLRQVALTIHGGRVYRPERLYAELGIRPFTPAPVISRKRIDPPAAGGSGGHRHP